MRVIGVEPEAAPTLARALEAGHPVDAEAGGIAADSLAPKRVGELMFPIAQHFVAGWRWFRMTAIEQAQQSTVERAPHRRRAGRSGCVGGAAVRRYQPKNGERVGVLVCGGNTTAVNFG